MADITLSFGENIGFGPERGTDVAVPVGTPVVSPFGGVFSSESLGQQDWGNRAFVDLGNGLTYAVGHLTQFARNPGDWVNPGDVIGYSGGAVGDPNSGVTTGPHVEFQFLQDGQYMNPQSVLDQLGLSFDQLFQPGTTSGLPSGPGPLTPPDIGLPSGEQPAFEAAQLFPSNFPGQIVSAFLEPAVTAGYNLGATASGQVQAPSIGITNVIPGLSQLGDFVGTLQRDALRAVFVLGGVLLIVLGIFVMAQTSSTVRQVEVEGTEAATKTATEAAAG